MVLRRGFKADANRYANEVREELGLAPHSKLCAWQLAELLGFQVVALSHFAQANPFAVTYFSEGCGRSEFSAITLPNGAERWIIHNDSHDLGRQAANISHECAHGLLIHALPKLLNETGRRHYDAGIEEEANWLGPALLISDAAALWIARRGYSLTEAAAYYGVSVELVRFRLNVTGAARRAA